MGRMNKLGLLFILFSVSINASEVSEGHDPTKPLSWFKSEPVKKKVVRKRQHVPVLQAINCIEQSECYAVLDNKSLQQGDKVSGYTLLSIDANNVLISRSGKQWQLSLFSLDIKN